MPNDRTGRELAKILELTPGRISQLAKEGVIKKRSNGKYPPAAITQYVRWVRDGQKERKWSELLEQEKYREKKRQNDVEEGLYAPVTVLEDVLGRGVSAMIPILEGLPLVLKRHWPQITGDQVRLVKEAIAECRNALADVEIKLDDD